jgi:hypothetical protein
VDQQVQEARQEPAHLGPAQLQGRQRRGRHHQDAAQETGGILRLKPSNGSRGGRKHTKAQQAKAVKRVYTIAKSNRRITRVYFYEWARKKGNRWDSAFVESNGALRPSYRALKRGLRVTGGAARAR